MEASPSKSIVHVPLKAGSLALGMHGCQLESVSSQYLETARSSVDNALNHSTQNTDATLPGDQLCIMADRCPATTCRASSSHDAGTTDVNTVADRCIAPATAPRRSTASPRTTAPASAEESCVPVAQNQLEKTKENISEPSHVGQMEGMADGMAPSSATQLAKARAPFRACQARQQRSRTQSCTGAFLRLPGTAATQLAKARAPFCACQSRQQCSRTQSCTGSLFCLPGKAATQQNAVLHGLLFALARQRSNAAERSLARAPCFACQGRQQHTWQARRASSPAVIQHDGTVRRKSWPSRGYPVLGHRVGQHGSQCDHSLSSWGFAAVCLTGEAGVRLM